MIRRPLLLGAVAVAAVAAVLSLSRGAWVALLFGVAALFVFYSPRTGGQEYVWHCHILEHEEHDMMRPLIVS